MYTVSQERMRDKIETFSKFGDTGNGGVTRYALSAADVQARNEFVHRMKAIGAVIEIDDLGDVYATLPGSDPEAKRIAMASHSDSVTCGGNYDGILGVMSAMEVLETVQKEGIPHRHPLTAMIWTNEEGSLYPPVMMCSGIVCWPYLPESIQADYHYEDLMKSKSLLDHTTTFAEALAASGYQGEKKYRLTPEKYACYFETHIEQGPILYDHKKDLGVVDCIMGMFNYKISFYGQANHAGTFPMKKRKDAFFAAAEALQWIHEEVDKLGYEDLVYTTGEIDCHPNWNNVVPDVFSFSFDCRHVDPKALAGVKDVLKRCAEREWKGCSCKVEKIWERENVFWDADMREDIRTSCEELGYTHEDIHSGAGHDAEFMGYTLPSAMIFVQSREGYSHCEKEFSSVEHCAEGASVMLNAVLKADARFD